MVTKAILVDAQALDHKYGARAQEVWKAVDDLVAADGNRGIHAQLVKLNDPKGPAGTAAVAPGTDWTAVKGAVDAVAWALVPDYLMLLGGPDLLPHCQLDNPAKDDEDPAVASDLPYACDAPASGTVADFRAPTRVVSRLPDVPETSEPDVFLQILEHARGWESRSRDDYEPYLGVSAEVWTGSTGLTLTQIYGDATEMQVSPPNGPAWSAALLDHLSHFANLHGAPASPQYYGQQGGSYPVAHDSAVIDGHVANGTVAAAEACYGAELFPPVDGKLAIPLAYLRSGAYGFFGSTTIAYGPATSNDWADVLCRLFQTGVLQGASIGRAGLQARQEYVAQSAPLDPIDLKTLAQFLILGDPSVQPVISPVQVAAHLAGEKAALLGVPARRERLRAQGEALGEVATWAQPIEGEPNEQVLAALRELAGVPAAGESAVSSFRLSGGPEPHGMVAYAAGLPPASATMHVLMQQIEPADAPMRQRIAVVAVEEQGRLVSVKTGATR
jgi:hypothetical protein